MKIRFFPFILLVLLFFPAVTFGALPEVEELCVYYKKETLDGKTFVFREDIANGVKKQVWSIDGQSVAYDEYEEAILDAEREVRKQERRAQAERREERQKGRLVARIELHKKVLRLMIDQIENSLKKFDDHRLVPFLAFNESVGFSQEEFESIEQELLKEAKRVLFTDGQEGDTSPFVTMINRLDGLSERLHGLFQKTVDNAIKLCDDTRMLKSLLEVV